MHALGIAHRDIKSHNVLIDSHMNVKVCDFGLAKFVVSQTFTSLFSVNIFYNTIYVLLQADIGKGAMQYAGTPTYMAPELFMKRVYDQSVDVFAYGCLLWEIICREVPNDGLDPEDIAQKVIKGEKLKEHAIASVDIRLADLVESCRSVEPQKRPNFKVIVETLDCILEDK